MTFCHRLLHSNVVRYSKIYVTTQRSDVMCVIIRHYSILIWEGLNFGTFRSFSIVNVVFGPTGLTFVQWEEVMLLFLLLFLPND